MSRLLRWWHTGSPSWRRLVLCVAVFAVALVVAVVCFAPGSSTVTAPALAAVVVAAIAALAGYAVVLRARIGGHRILSPRWYRTFVEQARAERAAHPGHPGEGR
ncbi:hypothetical protein ACPC54_18495 [Kitasatospora sp. NPDC094028]